MTKCEKYETFYKACITVCMQFRTGYLHCSNLQDGERACLWPDKDAGATLHKQVRRKNQARCLIACAQTNLNI
jgi:hypothetical protein